MYVAPTSTHAGESTQRGEGGGRETEAQIGKQERQQHTHTHTGPIPHLQPHCREGTSPMTRTCTPTLSHTHTRAQVRSRRALKGASLVRTAATQQRRTANSRTRREELEEGPTHRRAASCLKRRKKKERESGVALPFVPLFACPSLRSITLTFPYRLPRHAITAPRKSLHHRHLTTAPLSPPVHPSVSDARCADVAPRSAQTHIGTASRGETCSAGVRTDGVREDDNQKNKQHTKEKSQEEVRYRLQTEEAKGGRRRGTARSPAPRNTPKNRHEQRRQGREEGGGGGVGPVEDTLSSLSGVPLRGALDVRPRGRRKAEESVHRPRRHLYGLTNNSTPSRAAHVGVFSARGSAPPPPTSPLRVLHLASDAASCPRSLLSYSLTVTIRPTILLATVSMRCAVSALSSSSSRSVARASSACSASAPPFC